MPRLAHLFRSALVPGAARVTAARGDGGLDAAEERSLRALHEEILTWPGYWPHNLEGSYAPRADLETLDALDRPWLYLDRGHTDLERSPHCNTEDVRWVLVNRPFVLT